VPHRLGCVGSLAALGSTTTMAMHRRRSLVPPRCCSLVQPPPQPLVPHRRCSFMPPPLQPRATTAANTAAALCHRCCSLVPPPLVQPGPSLAPCCRSCLQHHHSFNLISPLTSQPQHSCHCHLTAITASCRPQPHVPPPPPCGIWSIPYSRDRRSAALKRLSGDLPGWTAF